MNKKEILETRCLLANIINSPPDNIEVINFNRVNGDPMFVIPYANMWDFCISFEKKPTKKQILRIIDEFLQVGEEWMDEEYDQYYDDY